MKETALELQKYADDISVLIVEDYKPVSDGLLSVLQNYFEDIELASNGKEAIDKYDARKEPFDIIISDIEMPHMNGIELTKEIYKRNPQQNVTIISAHKESEYLLELINIGVERFITKPIQTKEIVETLLNVTKKIKNRDKEHLVELTDNYYWNKKESILLNKESIVDLTKYELILFKMFMGNITKIYNLDDIREHFQDFKIDLDKENIRNMIAKLKKKIPKNIIINTYSKGYSLNTK